MTQLDTPRPPTGDGTADARLNGFHRTLGIEAARNLATTTKRSSRWQASRHASTTSSGSCKPCTRQPAGCGDLTY
jgi:hypothetical protein